MAQGSKRQEKTASEKPKPEVELDEAALESATGGMASAPQNWIETILKPPTTPYEQAKFGVGKCSK